MDFLVDLSRPMANAQYVEYVHRLVAVGARRFLLFGFTEKAVDVLCRLEPQREAFGLTLAVCDARAGTAELASVKTPCLRPEAAIAEPWDAVLVWDPAAAEGAFAFADAVARASGGRAPHVVYPGRRARGVLIVAFPKCGTHLVSRVMERLGYDVFVPPRIPEDVWARLKKDPFDLPENACFVPPMIRFPDIGDAAARSWHATREPAVVVAYRDPRDAICSYVHYLLGEAREPATATAPNLVHAAILKSLPTASERLMHAIEDPTFPYHGIWDVCAWMKKHPLVAQARFERLIGAAGGGSDAAQLAEVRALMRHVRAPGDAAEIARAVFDRSQRTFFRGQIGAWRREFTPEHVRAFARVFPGVLERYGYDEAAPADEPQRDAAPQTMTQRS